MIMMMMMTIMMMILMMVMMMMIMSLSSKICVYKKLFRIVTENLYILLCKVRVSILDDATKFVVKNIDYLLMYPWFLSAGLHLQTFLSDFTSWDVDTISLTAFAIGCLKYMFKRNIFWLRSQVLTAASMKLAVFRDVVLP
jgi:hypothetical protein